MSNNIKKTLASFSKIVLLTVATLCIALLLVWPLWKFATSNPQFYTILISSLIVILFLYLIVQKIRHEPFIKTLKFLINFIIIAAGLFFASIQLLQTRRLFFILILLITIVLLIITNLLFSRKKSSISKQNTSGSDK